MGMLRSDACRTIFGHLIVPFRVFIELIDPMQIFQEARSYVAQRQFQTIEVDILQRHASRMCAPTLAESIAIWIDPRYCTLGR